jgi:hypothetical protein
MKTIIKKGFYFKQYEALFSLRLILWYFKEGINVSGDFDEAIDWLRELDVRVCFH